MTARFRSPLRSRVGGVCRVFGNLIPPDPPFSKGESIVGWVAVFLATQHFR
jgi:hypothetical protein